MGAQLRFAPLIRVSTASQEEKGESLRTQRQQIAQAVNSLGGMVPEPLWVAYSGQEHATPDQERRKLDKLLKDASKGLFDAVIVADASRWSRDNRKSKEGLDILRQNGIKFFTGTVEHDLFSPEAALFLGMSAEIGEYQARIQALKSIQSRIHRAKRGVPASGNLPYGRTFDRKTETWGIDQEKKSRIEWAADQYLAGRPVVEIAKQFGMNHTSLWKILSLRSGDEWEVRFRNKKVNIDEGVIMKVPALLPPEIIEAIKKKSAAAKTYHHGHIKNQYLLGRMVFCAECGYAFFGQTNRGTRRYYRHPRGRVVACDPGLWVPAEDLEKAVMVNLFAMFGDADRLEQAVTRATPDQEQIDTLRHRLETLKTDREKIQQQKDRLVDAIADGLINKGDAKAKLDRIREQETSIEDEKARIESELEALPDYRRQLSGLAEAVRRTGGQMLSTRPERLSEMTYEERRGLVQAAFGGVDREGRRLGVYVRKGDDGKWRYEIRGIIPTESFYLSSMMPQDEGSLPMTKKRAQAILGVETDYSDFNPLDDKEQGRGKTPWPLPAPAPPGRRSPADTPPPGE